MNVKQTICICAVAVFFVSPSLTIARTNVLTSGLSLALDHDDRSYDSTDTGEENSGFSDDGDYSSFSITPSIQLTSDGRFDHVQLRYAPSIKYDLIDSGSDWDHSLFVSGDRFITKKWQVSASDSYINSDYQNNETDSSSPELSSDLGRQRYWRNTLTIGSDYNFGLERGIHIGFDYIVLRNEDSNASSNEDYDRYVVNLRDTHRFNSAWKSIIDLSFVRGEFDTVEQDLGTGVDASSLNDDLSDDVKEYRLSATLENNSFQPDTLYLDYNYIGTKYDEPLRDDGDIHELQLSSRNNLSQRLSTRFGAGPSYEKTEGRDANWGGNGIAEINYQLRHGSTSLVVEKRYDVENFSGTDDRGFVDLWDARIQLNYNLLQDLALDASIAYRYEDREEPVSSTESLGTDSTTEWEEYHEDRYIASVGINYNFLPNWFTGLNYTFTSLDSDREGEDYDDHRVVFSISWEQELLRW